MYAAFNAFQSASPFQNNKSSGSDVFTHFAKQSVSRKESLYGIDAEAVLKSSAQRALMDANDLISKNGAFSFRSVDSSDAAVATGEAVNGAQTATSFKIEVSQLAGGRDIVSSKLAANEHTAAGRGVFSFRVNIDNKETRITVQANALDTNEELLGKIASGINEAGLGLKATVEKNNYADTVRLRISGIKAEDMHSFTLADETGGLLSSIGVSTARSASGQTGGLLDINGNASIRINGALFQSDSNRIAVYENTLVHQRKMSGASAEEVYNATSANSGALPSILDSSARHPGGLQGSHLTSFNINGAGQAATQITPNASKTADEIEEFVANTGDMVRNAEKIFTTPYSSARSYILGAFGRLSPALTSAGINASELKVESRRTLEDKISNHPESVKELFTGPNGVAQRSKFGIQRAAFGISSEISGSVSLNPAFDAVSSAFGSSL